MEDATVTIGNNDLLEKVEWKIMPGERWAIVGPNGTGKSTMLKAITGQDTTVKLTTGRLVLHPTAAVGYLEQKGVSGSTLSVYDEVKSRMDRLQAATAALEKAEAEMETCDVNDPDCLNAAIEAITEAQTEFENCGGYNVDEKISKILNGLGFKEADWGRSCSDFSGGWQMRIALARLLLSEPELLILDEPTNHLDAAAKRWVASYLSSYQGSVLIVSHDENLLDKATSSIAEVRSRKLELYKSRTYAQWKTERVDREAQRAVAWEKQQAELAELQAFVDKWGAGTKSASAQSRQKQIDKIMENLVEAPEGVAMYVPKLKLPKPPPCHFEQLEMTEGAFGWGTKPIVEGANFLIEKGMRVVVRGPNGAGKSTMLRAMSGELELKSGALRRGEGLELGFFKQDLAQALPLEERGVDVVQKAGWVANPELTVTETRTTMGALGLTGEKSTRLVKHLSGGEKARVALACFSLVPHNMLLLDEPSNHLDVETIQSLSKALQEFKGAVVVVSHDRKFCEALQPTHVMTVENGRMTFEARQLTDADWKDDEISAQAVEVGAAETEVLAREMLTQPPVPAPEPEKVMADETPPKIIVEAVAEPPARKIPERIPETVSKSVKPKKKGKKGARKGK